MYQKTSFIKDLAENVSIDDLFALEGMELLPFREKPGMFLKMRFLGLLEGRMIFVSHKQWEVRHI
jgi:hypothetical protein